jgi:hypothetical protein
MIPLHGVIRDRMARLIGNYFRKNSIGGAVATGSFGVSGERWLPLNLWRTPIPFAPDIAVEVLSPSEHTTDMTCKVRDYPSVASQEVWLLDPDLGELQIHPKSDIRLLGRPPKLPGSRSVLPNFLRCSSEPFAAS